MSQAFDLFLELSAVLTGYSRIDLLGTGVAEEYWTRLKKETSEETTNELVAIWQAASSDPDPEKKLQDEVLPDAEFGPLVKNIIRMWYLGNWGGGFDAMVVSADAYQQGLVWDAIGAHPQTAKQPGYGTWSLPPTINEE